MARETAKAGEFQRFNIHHRIQHIMMFSSFILCTITGLPIKYNESFWAPAVTSFFGGFETMFTIHLVGAVVMLACSAYHLVYLAIYPIVVRKPATTRRYPPGEAYRKISRGLAAYPSLAMLPTPKDVLDLLQNMRYFLGLSSEKPKFGRYSYKEKFDYWAVFWGMAIMGGSGLMMWFPQLATEYFPRWLVDASRYAHSDEAMLAILAIFVWHFFNVHLNPTFFPMNFVWFHGKMSRELMEEEHPDELRELEERTPVETGRGKPQVRPVGVKNYGR